MSSKRIDEIITEIEDARTSIEEVEAGVNDTAELRPARKTLERVTDELEEINENTDSE